MLCRKCGLLVADGNEWHVLCSPIGYEPPKSEDKPLFQRATDPSGMSFLEIDIRDTLTEIIQWGARRGRGEQVPVGPSEIGTPCDRELAYRIAGVAGVHSRILFRPSSVPQPTRGCRRPSTSSRSPMV